MAKQNRLSASLEEVCAFFRDAKQSYTYYSGQMLEQEKLECDLLHELELKDTNCAERSKTATKLKKCLQERRVNKDQTELLRALIEFLEKPEYRHFIDDLSRVLGEVRKVEKRHVNRFYTPRVMKAEEENREEA